MFEDWQGYLQKFMKALDPSTEIHTMSDGYGNIRHTYSRGMQVIDEESNDSDGIPMSPVSPI
jgi:hypothetical protein